MLRKSSRKRRKVRGVWQDQELPYFMRLWLLRILVPLGGHRGFMNSSGFCDDELALRIGLEEYVGGDPDNAWRRGVLTKLKKMHKEAERASLDEGIPMNLSENIGKISDLAGLSVVDRAILTFVVFLHTEGLLDDAADLLGELSANKVFRVVSVLLGCPEKAVRASLSSKGVLAHTGLVTLRHGHRGSTLRDNLDILSSGFAESILHTDADPVGLLRDIVVPSMPATLCFDDFTHLAPYLATLRPYLRHAVSSRCLGANVLLHGVPGTGKSELSRLLAQELGCELFEVANEDENGEPIKEEARLKAFRAAQGFFANRQAILLFDEIEDVFGYGGAGFLALIMGGSPNEAPKAWINRMLEQNQVPTIWVTNSVDSLDRAYVRRFDIVIEMPVPPMRQRERIIRQVCGDLLPADVIARIARHEKVAPALVSRAASVARSIVGEIGEDAIPDTVERLVNSTLEAQRHKPLPKRHDPSCLPGIYDPSFAGVDADLAEVANGLASSGSGRLCLYGPPGTGKTAFGRWLSERLGIPLLVKRGSDLLSKWVGGTEANIASAFREAERDGALLLIDEVDGFLQDRRRAQRSWEVTGVNELLTQMESFPGIFIASTNLMDGIDQAALRRFDLKLRFGYLQPEQAWQLFVRQCAALVLVAPAKGLKQAVARLTVLTPGDFATVARQHRFRPIGNPAALLTALEQECLVKEEGQAKTIGF